MHRLYSSIILGDKMDIYSNNIIGQCDSCIGGKTSINYKGVKNQIGISSRRSNYNI